MTTKVVVITIVFVATPLCFRQIRNSTRVPVGQATSNQYLNKQLLTKGTLTGEWSGLRCFAAAATLIWDTCLMMALPPPDCDTA
jgi:hypothetical protein